MENPIFALAEKKSKTSKKHHRRNKHNKYMEVDRSRNQSGRFFKNGPTPKT